MAEIPSGQEEQAPKGGGAEQYYYGNRRTDRQMYPHEILSSIPLEQLTGIERERVINYLEDLALGPILGIGNTLEDMQENTGYKQRQYPLPNVRDDINKNKTEVEKGIRRLPEEEKKILMGLVASDLNTEKAHANILIASLPYLTMYYSGIDSLSAVRERNSQLGMATLVDFFGTKKDAWIEKGIREMNETLLNNLAEFMPLADISVKSDGTKDIETVADKLSIYTADAYYWNQVLSELVTHNPLLGDESPHVSAATFELVATLFKREPRVFEDCSGEELKDADATRVVKIYQDSSGNQLTQKDGNLYNEDGTEVVDKKEVKKTSIVINLLDYFNNTRSETERKIVIATISALVIHKAREVLNDIDDIGDSNFSELLQKVRETRDQILANEIPHDTDSLKHKIAQTAFYTSVAIAFQTFAVADWGYYFKWSELKDGDGRLKYVAVGEQGDPTASGDAFTAAKPNVHEIAYAAEKNRPAANNVGTSIPIDPTEARKYINMFLSEASKKAERNKSLEVIVKGGEQPHLEQMFGILGIFEPRAMFAKLSVNEKDVAYKRYSKNWSDGEKIRERTQKSLNSDVKQLIEETIIFLRTPYKGLYFPFLTPQFNIGLFDMMSVGDKYTVSDVLKKSWKKDVDGNLIIARPEDGGKRRTLRDVGWANYGPNVEDGRAVNNNFMYQLISHVYGPVNEKINKQLMENPAAFMTSIIKAVDIGLRGQRTRLEDGRTMKDIRPALEVLFTAQITFEYLVFGGGYKLMGSDGVLNLKFLTESAGKKDKPNLITILRTVEDFLPQKGKVDKYGESIHLVLVSLLHALRPIVETVDNMADYTYGKYNDNNPLDSIKD